MTICKIKINYNQWKARMGSSMVKIIKKDGTLEKFNEQKIVVAISKSADRVMVKLTPQDIEDVCAYVKNSIAENNLTEVPIKMMHNLVESALDRVDPRVAKSYRDYRNYKQDFVHMLYGVFKKAQTIMYIGDKENANTDSALVATKRSLIFNQLNKELYQKFFLTTDELQACKDGYIYVHDMSALMS